MKKFEEEFNYLIELSGKVLTGQIEAEKFENQRAIFLNEYGQKHQPEIPEVPQFVADWYEENKGDLEYRIWDYIRCWNSQEKDDFYNFMNNVKSIETILAMKNGYTVKEKRFYLKNKLTGLYLAIDSSTYIEIEEKWLDAKRITSYKPFFTQQEIDSMETGSYEQIEVEE